MKKENRIIFFALMFVLCGCSTYPSKFRCGDARGLGCRMLAEVDRQIDSGEIEKVYSNDKDCKGKECHKQQVVEGMRLKHQDIGNYYDEGLESPMVVNDKIRF